MFLNLLDDNEKRAFAALAEKMIASDGIVVGREAATLGAFKGEMGLGAETVDSPNTQIVMVATMMLRMSAGLIIKNLSFIFSSRI